MALKTTRSKTLFKAAQHTLAGGVNSPVRAFKAVGGTPLFMARGKGPYIWDADGNRYVDFVSSWGPLILGHAAPAVQSAVRKQMSKGFTFGVPTELETQLGRMVQEAIPSIEKIRFVSSGTEAVMSALRLARAFTGRDKIVKFNGCYHGHSDGLLVKAGSGAATLALPDSAGVPQSFSSQTLSLPYNDLESVRACFKRWGKDIAAVIVEPVAGNMGLVLPEEGFLKGLRTITAHYKSQLIFDEVITGFRMSYGGAQSAANIRPDLTCLGKIIGGGFPVGAFGGRKNIMDQLAPLGPVYQAGTLSGNPVAMSAGIATLNELKKRNPYAVLKKRAAQLADFIGMSAFKLGVPVQVHQAGSMFTVFFAERPVTDYASAKLSDTRAYAKFFHALLEEGIYFPPAQFEAAFLSTEHSDAILDQVCPAIVRALKKTQHTHSHKGAR